MPASAKTCASKQPDHESIYPGSVFKEGALRSAEVAKPVVRDDDVVLNSQDAATLEKSLRVLKPGGKLISVSGPPDPDFATELGLPWFVKLVMTLLSAGARRKARKLGVTYSFLFMRADGKQLAEIASLIDGGKIGAVIDRIFPFEETNAALDYVEAGRAKGKVAIKVR